MGEVVRPDFHRSPSTALQDALPVVKGPLSLCGFAGVYRVALYEKEDPSAAIRVVIMRYDSDTMYPVATLPATTEGRIEAHTVANAVLNSLRLASSFSDGLIK